MIASTAGTLDARSVVFRSGGEVAVEGRPIPEPVADQVRIRVTAAGCNRADLLQRDGRYPAPPGWPQDVPGLEFAGTVLDVGSSVRELRPGDRVMGLVGGGAHSELLLTREDACVRIPDSLDPAAAGAIPEAFFTAMEALVVQGAVRPGSRVLVNAVGSGIGTALAQLGSRLGARVVGTTRSPAKLAGARDLGMHDGLVVCGDDSPVDAASALCELAGGGFDVAVDLVGGTHFSVAIGALREGGTLVSLGFLDDQAVHVDLRQVVSRRLRVVGTSLRARRPHERAHLTERFAREVVPLLAADELVPVIDRAFAIDDVAAAYEALATNSSFGKVLLHVS